MKTLALGFLCLSFTLTGFSAFGRTAPEDEFLFRFALQKEQGSGASTVYVQAEHQTQETMARVCGLSGLACACELTDAAGNLLERIERASFDYRGNYFRCVPTLAHPNLAFARIVERKAGGLAGPFLPVETARTLTLGTLLGHNLDMNRVRGVYRYTCEFNFLQKEGTTTQSFDCSYQPTSCSPDGDSSKNFCLLQARFPYHLFADNHSTNFHQRVADRLYNGGGTGRICGMQLKLFDCSGVEHMPVRTFGLFGEQTGYWDTSVSLTAGPDLVPVSYGFAARTSTDTGECPPGLEKRVFYRAEVDTTDIRPSHNFTSGLPAMEIARTELAPPAFSINKLAGGSGGTCANGYCTLPNSWAGTVKSFGFSSAGQTEFCVIPSGMLP